MNLKKILALVFLGIILSIPAFADETKKDENETGKAESKDKPKPYGCFKDLKWGMSLEDAQKSLGISLKKYPFTIKGITVASGEIKIADKDYKISCSFGPSGLSFVQIEPKAVAITSQSFGRDFAPGLAGGISGLEIKKTYDTRDANILIDAYNTFKPSLIEKFGKPTKESAEDRGSDVALTNNIIVHKASLLSVWETGESIITLTVETLATQVNIPDPNQRLMWQPLLQYRIKTAEEGPKKEEKKVEL